MERRWGEPLELIDSAISAARRAAAADRTEQCQQIVTLLGMARVELLRERATTKPQRRRVAQPVGPDSTWS